MNLDFISQLLSKLSVIKINQELCMRKVSPRFECDRCQQACPGGAISLEDEIEIDEKCTNCGACVSACPAGVFTVSEPEDEYLLQRASQVDNLIIVCEKNKKHFKKKTVNVFKVECLSRLYFELLLALAVEVKGSVYIFCNEELCKGCANFRTIDNLKSEVHKANSILRECKKFNTIQWKDYIPQDILEKAQSTRSAEYDESRRQFFAELIKGAKKLPEETLSYILNDEDTESNQKNLRDILKKAQTSINFKRRFLIEVLHKIHAREDISRLKMPVYKRLNFSECYLCGICEKLCIHSALRKTEGGDLEINYSRCSNCGICIAACNNNSISFGEPLTVYELVTGKWQRVVRSTERYCQQCNSKFVAGDDIDEAICLKCRMERVIAGDSG